MPSAQAVGAAMRTLARRQLAREHGTFIARAVKAFGFNTTLAPVVDLGLPEAAEVLGSRTAGATSEEVIVYARDFLAGLAAQGIAGCGKHFPGLGGATGDTHFVTPAIARTTAQISNEDLAPYRTLHAAMPMVMTNHAAYPATPGRNLPASASPYWITTALRKRIGYRGIILSDDLEMGGILKFISVEEAAIAAIRAGSDLIEICHSPELILRSYEALLTESERSASFRTLLLDRARTVERKRARLYAAKLPHPLTTKQFETLRTAIARFTEKRDLNDNRRHCTTRSRACGDLMKPRSMLVAGVMSGTSADGIDVALVRIAPGRLRPQLTLVAHEAFPYSAALRRAVLAAMNAQTISTAELARLNWRLGLAYADAVTATSKRHSANVELIGCHGQTLYHQARADAYAGRRFACTWQLGESAVIGAAAGVPVVSNFRPADMAAGGQGAPLVSLLDYVLFADPRLGRVLQNIGGIANLTAIPAGATIADVVAFDNGPGNMVIDALMHTLYGEALRSQWCNSGARPGACASSAGNTSASLLQAQPTTHRRP